MVKGLVCAVLGMVLFVFPLWAGDGGAMDTIRNSGGDLQISFIGHGTRVLLFYTTNPFKPTI
jgi:hypothetical protein